MMKKILMFLLIIFVTGCNSISTTDYIKQEINLDISSCDVLTNSDTHGGFHGDGEYFVKAKCPENMIEQVSSWNRLPLSENLQLIMYGGEKEGVTYAHEFAIEMGIPKIENGYYLFIDRNSESTDIYSDKELFDRYSRNFTIVFYDLDTNYLYYFEEDT